MNFGCSTLKRYMRRLHFAALYLVPVLSIRPPIACAEALAADPARPAVVEAVNSVALTVGDMDRSIVFFTSLLDFQKIQDTVLAEESYEKLYGVPGARIRVVALRLGDERIELHQFLTPRGRPMPADSRANDHWFQHIAIITRDMDAAYARMEEHHVKAASRGPQTLPAWNKHAGGVRAYYFRDPDGHFLEILQFPPGKGDPRWHRRNDRLFLGIDHTAIVVADTETSLALYRDVLGLRVAGAGENYGIEQERLNNVVGARLRITTLRPVRGPGIELLEYLSPRDGRPAPSDSRPNDLWHWHVRLRCRDTADVENVAAQGNLTKESPGPVRLPEISSRNASALLRRDPDGHAILLTAP